MEPTEVARVAREAFDAGEAEAAYAVLAGDMPLPWDARHGPVVDLLVERAPEDLDAVFFAAMMMLEGGEGILDVKQGVRIAEDALARGHDGAHRLLGSAYMGRFGGLDPDWTVAAAHFKAGMAAGVKDCAFNYGCLLLDGHVVDADVTPEAAFRAALAVAPDDSAAKTNLAATLLADEATFREAMRLLKEAAPVDDLAERLLAAVEDLGGDHEAGREVYAQTRRTMGDFLEPPTLGKHWRPGEPPVKTIPKDLVRANACVGQVQGAFDLKLSDARLCVAKMHGYRSWDELAKDIAKVAKGKLAATKPDSRVDGGERARRRDFQSYALKRQVPRDDSTILEATRMLAVSSDRGRPSLRDLDRAQEGKVLPGMTEKGLDAAMRELVDAAGVDIAGRDPLKMIRMMRPVRQDVWLGLAEAVFGWTFADKDMEVDAPLSRVATTRDSDGNDWAVYMTPMSYVPGDDEDFDVADLMGRIEAEHGRRAILGFNPGLRFGREASDLGLLYGGRILLADGSWSDFAFRRGGGLEDAVAQAPHWEGGSPDGCLYDATAERGTAAAAFCVDGMEKADGVFEGHLIRKTKSGLMERFGGLAGLTGR